MNARNLTLFLAILWLAAYGASLAAPVWSRY